MEILDVPPEVVQPARVFAPKKCKAKGCENIFTPTVGYQTYCPDHRADRERTKRSREKAKRKAEAEAKRANSMTREQFWNENRKKLKKSERDRLETRTEDILFLCDVLDDYIAGTDQTSQQDLEDTIVEVAAEVAEHGVCNLHTILVEFWKPWERDFYDALQARGENHSDAIFTRLGYIVALPGHVYHRFAQKFMQPKTNPTVKSEWVTLTCTTPGCGQGLHAMPRELANEYAVRSIKPFCYRCLDLERKSAAQAAIFTEPAAKIYDGYGRIRDFDRDMEHG